MSKYEVKFENGWIKKCDEEGRMKECVSTRSVVSVTRGDYWVRDAEHTYDGRTHPLGGIYEPPPSGPGLSIEKSCTVYTSTHSFKFPADAEDVLAYIVATTA
jgi:hypothetical protein